MYVRVSKLPIVKPSLSNFCYCFVFIKNIVRGLLVCCYLFAQEWLESQGIELSKEEELPVDAYTQKEMWKTKHPPKRVTCNADPLRRFLEYDGKVLA